MPSAAKKFNNWRKLEHVPIHDHLAEVRRKAQLRALRAQQRVAKAQAAEDIAAWDRIMAATRELSALDEPAENPVFHSDRPSGRYDPWRRGKF